MAGGRRLKIELVRRVLSRCAELAEAGRHRKVLEEVARALPSAEGTPELEGELLIWRAQALLAMGMAGEAEVAAQSAWERMPCPQACDLVACALADLGELEEAERMLLLGDELFPEAPHLKIRLATLLTEQGRLPEALDCLEEIAPDQELDEATELFLLGLKSNILGVLGHWEQAESLLRHGLQRFPGNRLLEETGANIESVRRRSLAGDRLAELWESELTELFAFSARDVDDAIVELARELEIPRLVELAARRLWRSFLAVEQVRPRAVEAWALAVLLAVTRLDGLDVPVSPAARAVWANEGTVRQALRRVEGFLGGFDDRFARRQFAAMANPRLDEEPNDQSPGRKREGGTVLRFPDPTRGEC